MNIDEALKKMRENSKKRKFVQTVDLIINLRDVDVKNPSNRFVLEIPLPAGRGKNVRVCVIGKSLAEVAKELADEVVDEKTLEKIEEDKKAIKKLVKRNDFFLTEPQLMARIGKSMGRFMGPRNKMPKPVPPQADIKSIIEKLKRSIRVVLKDSPLIQCPIGTEDMSDEDLKKNFEAVINAVIQKLPAGKQNIKSIYIKTTMGSPVKVDEL